ncbi:MAG: hydrolase, partial [Actinomycetota bacterium]|nr:hydrolase [Actinomycetota bacterium]
MEFASMATGAIAGPISGLKYETPSTAGITNERGEFQYRDGESVTFLIGGIVLGSVEGAPRVNLAQLVDRVDGKIDRLHDPMVTNFARLIQTLDQDGTVENGVTIAPIVHDNIKPMVFNINHASTDAA